MIQKRVLILIKGLGLGGAEPLLTAAAPRAAVPLVPLLRGLRGLAPLPVAEHLEVGRDRLRIVAENPLNQRRFVWVVGHDCTR